MPIQKFITYKLFHPMIIRALLLIWLIMVSVWGNTQTYFVKDGNADTTQNDFKASRFGIRSDGVTLNTASIQKAIDFISEQGGGRLVFYVGRYLTGSIQMRSNVTLHLEEGAVLVASEAIYNYKSTGSVPALILANNISHSGISGKGVVEGNGASLVNSRNEQITKGYLKSTTKTPALIAVDSCTHIFFSVQNYLDVAAEVLVVRHSSQVIFDSAAVKLIPGNDHGAITVSNSSRVKIMNSYFEAGSNHIVNTFGNVEELAFVNALTSKGQELKFSDGKVVLINRKDPSLLKINKRF